MSKDCVFCKGSGRVLISGGMIHGDHWNDLTLDEMADECIQPCFECFPDLEERRRLHEEMKIARRKARNED